MQIFDASKYLYSHLKMANSEQNSRSLLYLLYQEKKERKKKHLHEKTGSVYFTCSLKSIIFLW